MDYFKFKVGDRVKVVKVNVPSKEKHVGKTFVIKRRWNLGALTITPAYNFEGEGSFNWFEEELELVKPKFNYADYAVGKYEFAMHIKTAEQAKIFNRYFKWYTGRNYSVGGEFDFMRGHTDICFNLHSHTHSHMEYYIRRHYTILEFEDFDWSDFEMKKNEFTKADLKNGDVVKWSDGDIQIVCVDTGTLICKNTGFDSLKYVSDDLRWTGHIFGNKDTKILAVRRPNEPCDCQFSAFDNEYGTLVYERKEVEEMTLEEVCKALGKEIKIVKK